MASRPAHDFPAPAAPRFWHSFAAPCALVGLIAIVYAGALQAECLVWATNDHIHASAFVTGPGGYPRAWRNWRDPSFYPGSFSSFYVEWRLGDGRPWLFHLDNVLLHAGNALLAGLLGRALG